MANIRNQFSKWNSTKVKASYNYTCAECGSTENIQAHDPTKKHINWRDGVALCGDCHSKKHPDVPAKLFGIKWHQPYWPNISARSLAKIVGCHNRTIIRRAKALKIPMGAPLSKENKKRLIYDTVHIPKPKENYSNDSEIRNDRLKLNLTQSQFARKLGVNVLTVSRWERGLQQPSRLARYELQRLHKKNSHE